MITEEQIRGVVHRPVYGGGGEKIGEARNVFYDVASGRPQWVTVKTGIFAGGETFVPVRDAVMAEGRLAVPYSKAKVRGAPHVAVDAEGHLSADEEERLFAFYGIRAREPAPRTAERQQEPQEPQERQQEQEPEQTELSGQASPHVAATAEQAARQPAERQATGPAAVPDTAETMAVSDAADATAGVGDVMTRSEEEMHVRVERREAGRVRLQKYVVTEEQQMTVPLRHEEVRLVREPITEDSGDRAALGTEISESEHEVILHAERPVVETTVEAKERVRLTTEERTEQETVRGKVRKERIKLEGADEEGERP